LPSVIYSVGRVPGGRWCGDGGIAPGSSPYLPGPNARPFDTECKPPEVNAMPRCRVARAPVNETSSVAWESKFAHGVSSLEEGAVSWVLALAASMRSWPAREGVNAEGHATMPEFMGSDGAQPDREREDQ